MRIGVDVGCLGISDERLKGGIYRMAENLLDPTGTRELVSSMESFTENKKLRQEKIIRGLTRMPLFSWKNYAKEVLAISWKMYKS